MVSLKDDQLLLQRQGKTYLRLHTDQQQKYQLVEAPHGSQARVWASYRVQGPDTGTGCGPRCCRRRGSSRSGAGTGGSVSWDSDAVCRCTLPVFLKQMVLLHKCCCVCKSRPVESGSELVTGRSRVRKSRPCSFRGVCFRLRLVTATEWGSTNSKRTNRICRVGVQLDPPSLDSGAH